MIKPWCKGVVPFGAHVHSRWPTCSAEVQQFAQHKFTAGVGFKSTFVSPLEKTLVTKALANKLQGGGGWHKALVWFVRGGGGSKI